MNLDSLMRRIACLEKNNRPDDVDVESDPPMQFTDEELKLGCEAMDISMKCPKENGVYDVSALSEEELLKLNEFTELFKRKKSECESERKALRWLRK